MKSRIARGSDEVRATLNAMAARKNGDQPSSAPVPSAENQSEPKVAPKKRTLGGLFLEATKGKGMKEVRESLEFAQSATPQAIRDYVVELRWQINSLPGMPDGFGNWSWDKQSSNKELLNLARKMPALSQLIDRIDEAHADTLMATTLNDVMDHIGTPLQGVENMQQFKNFLDHQAKDQNGIVEMVENPKHQPEDGITILTDLGDATNHNEATYLPKRMSKVARDGWLVVREKFQQVAKLWEQFERLRNAAGRRLTPFNISDKPAKDGKSRKRGLSGKLFVMPRSGASAFLINVDRNDEGHKLASIVDYVGIEENALPAPNQIEWDDRHHALKDPSSDVWVTINEALEELNARQHTKAMDEKQKGDLAFKPLDDQATLSSSRASDYQGLQAIRSGEKGSVSVCARNFSIRKSSGKVKTGHFGILVECVEGTIELVDAAASECFCFDKSLIGKKFPFTTKMRQRETRGNTTQEIQIIVSIKDFCQMNNIRSRLGNDMFTSIFMVARLLERRLNDERRFSPDDYEDQDEEVEVEVEVDEVGETVLQTQGSTDETKS
jgi:hypothetical protein